MQRVSILGIILCAAACATDATTEDTTTEDTSDFAQATTSSVGPYFATPMFFNRDVSALPKAANSNSIIATLAAAGGWGYGNRVQIDYALDVLTANATTPKRAFTPNGDFYTPDCDH